MGLVLNWRQVFEIDDLRYSKEIFGVTTWCKQTNGTLTQCSPHHPRERCMVYLEIIIKKKTGKTLRFFPRQRYLAYDNRMKFSSSKSIICSEKNNRLHYFFPLK